MASVGTGQPFIKPSDVREHRVLLPTLVEQQRIVAILNRADGIYRKRRASLEKLGQLEWSVFFTTFDFVSIPRRRLDELVEVEVGLVDPRKEAYGDLPHIAPQHIIRDTGELLPYRTAREDGVTSGKFLFDNGCVLYSKIRPNLNKVTLAPEKGICSADMYVIRPKPGLATREFIWFLLRSIDFLNHALALSDRANIPKINREQLLSYLAPAPDIYLQRKFAMHLAAIETLVTRCRTQLVHAEALLRSIKNDVFSTERGHSVLEGCP